MVKSRKMPVKQLFILTIALFSATVIMCYRTSNPIVLGRRGPDSSVFVYVAKVIINGGMPYRDTFDHKGPLLYLINVLGLIINKDLGLWFIEVANLCIIFVLTYKLSKLVGCNFTQSVIGMITGALVMAYRFDGGNFTEEYACTFILLALDIFAKSFQNDKVSLFEILICGLAFGAVCLLRINMISLWLVMCVGVLLKCVKENKVKYLFKFITYFILGVIIIVAPILLWLGIRGAFNDFINDYFIFNFMYSGASFNDRLVALYVTTSLPDIIISVPIFVILVFRKRKYPNLSLMCFISLILSVGLSVMSGRYFYHYGMAWYPLVLIAIAQFFAEMSSVKVNKKTLISLYSAYICAIICTFNVLIFQYAYSTLKLLVDRVDFDGGEMEEINQIVQIVINETEKNDKITVCGNRDIIYLLSDRESVSKYSYQSPISSVNETILEEYIMDIETLQAKIIVAASSDMTYTYVKPIIEQHYTLVDKINKSEIYVLNHK